MSARGGRAVRQNTVLHIVLSLEPGGTERLVVQMSNRLSESGFTVHVCCLDTVGALRSDLAPCVTVHEVRRPGRFDPRVAWRIANLATSVGAGIIHCHQYTPFVYGSLAAILLPSVRLISTEHGRLSGTSLSTTRRRVNRVLSRVKGQQFAVSEELRQFMIREGYSPRRVNVIHNGVKLGPTPSPMSRLAARRSLGVADGSFVVGTTARFDPVKDLETLIVATGLAARTLPAVQLVLIGDGQERSALQKAAAASGANRVQFAGYLSHARELLPAFDVFANTSTSEGISLAILEAMAAQVAVVATAVGGTPEIIRDRQDGWLVPPRSPTAVAEALAFLGSNVGTRLALAGAGRVRVHEAFSFDRMLAAYIQAYRSR